MYAHRPCIELRYWSTNRLFTESDVLTWSLFPVLLYNITEAVITPVTAKLTLIITESDFTVTEAVMIKYIYLIHYSSYCNALQQL